jgi:type I restriction enzyme, S subunit
MSVDFQIPSGWTSAPLREVARKIVDGSHNPPPKQESGFPMLSARNVGWSTIEFSEFRYIAKDAFEAERKRADLQPDDVLLTIVGTIGRAAVIPQSAEQFALQRSVAMIRPNGMDSKFCMYQFLSERVQKWLRDSARGSAQQGVYLKTLGTLPMLVAPLPEQRRIVAEIEKQFTRLEAGVAALRRVRANLKRYRAAVLKAACEGRLVPTDLSAWKQLKVSEIGEAITGNTPPTSDKANLGDELPFFKPTDLDAGYNVRGARQYLSAKGAKHARVLPASAVLVTCIGATIGKTGFARVDCATNQQINALVVNAKIATPQWAFWLFSSPIGQQQIKTNASATTLPILNKSKFEALEFPVPSLAAQTRIVAEVERRLSVVEELESVVTANLQRATRLRQSILQKAFTGGLITTRSVK